MNKPFKQGPLSNLVNNCLWNKQNKLFMKYLKKGCFYKDGKLCDFCQAHDWVGLSQERIPQPVSYPNNPDHYMKPFETPTSRRFPDDFQGRQYNAELPLQNRN